MSTQFTKPISFKSFNLPAKHSNIQLTKNQQTKPERFRNKKENFDKPFPFKFQQKHNFMFSNNLVKSLQRLSGKHLLKPSLKKGQGKPRFFNKNLKSWKKNKQDLRKKFWKRAQKANFRHVKMLKKFVFYPKKLRSRFIYKLMLVTKQAFLQYYRRFNMRNYARIQKLYRNNFYQLTRFEKFIMFFEFRLNCCLVRIRYAKYTLYSNMLILTGQIRVNGKIVLYSDYQVKLHDLLEIAYLAFFRQYFKRYVFRPIYRYLPYLYGKVFRHRSKKVYFYLYKKFRFFPKWLFSRMTRVFKIAPFYSFFLRRPRNDYFVQSGRVLATIFFLRPYRFLDRRFVRFMTKKHMKFFSNFCTTFS